MSNHARAQRVRGLRLTALALLVAALAGAPAYAQDAAPARGDLSVDQAVRLALERNKDLLTARANVKAAAGIRNQALQAYLPSLATSASYSHSFNPQPRLDQNTGQLIDDRNNWGVRYSLSQNIFDIASLKNISAAGKDLEASKLDYDFSRSDLVLVTRQQYYALLAAQELASVSDSALALSQRELQRTQSLFELGMVAKSDVLKAQVRVSSSQLDVIRDHGNVVVERARLARILGQEPTDDLRASDPLTASEVAVDSTAIFQEASANRADLQAAKKTWEAAKGRAGAARAGWLFPTLGAQVTYANGNGGGLQPFAGFDDDTRVAAVGLTFPLFDGIFRHKGEVQTAQARAEVARYAYERLQLDVAVEVRQAISNARQANEGVTVARTGLESAEEDLKLSQEKYNVGSGTILDLLDAQVNLQRARQQYVASLTQARIAEAQIARARGVIP